MKIFLDTSILFKLYHREAGTAEFERDLSAITITGIFLCEIAKVEFTSTVWKKVRTKEITEPEAKTTLDLFETDFEKYNFEATDSVMIEQARLLAAKYGKLGLRTLDSIQLSAAVLLRDKVDTFFTADKLLKSLFAAEGLAVEMPGAA